VYCIEHNVIWRFCDLDTTVPYSMWCWRWRCVQSSCWHSTFRWNCCQSESQHRTCHWTGMHTSQVGYFRCIS